MMDEKFAKLVPAQYTVTIPFEMTACEVVGEGDGAHLSATYEHETQFAEAISVEVQFPIAMTQHPAFADMAQDALQSHLGNGLVAGYLLATQADGWQDEKEVPSLEEALREHREAHAAVAAMPSMGSSESEEAPAAMVAAQREVFAREARAAERVLEANRRLLSAASAG